MSSAQRVDSTDDHQPVTVLSDETGDLAASVMRRTHWLQRALSPWVQRWLSSGDSEGAPDQAGGRRPFASSIIADTQRTLARLHVQYQSHSNLETLAASNSLPLAGTVERPGLATESAVPAAPRRAQGPYARPFNSLDDFIQAIEAAKERNYAPPPPETQSRPAPKREVGPYARPFNSLDEFVQAIEAAKERNYAPPPEIQSQPAPKREAGPYSRAFSSFEDFAKAVEETRDQWGPTVAAVPSVEGVEPPLTSEPPSSMSARVRPISQIEELPARVETGAISRPVELPAPPSKPTPTAKPAVTRAQPQSAPSATPAATRAQPKSAPPATPQPAAAPASPQVQRSPLESSSDLNEIEDEVGPDVQRSATPTLQRLEAPTRSELAAPAASSLVEPAATPELDQVVPGLSQSTAPQMSRPLDMPLVQRQAADSEVPEEVSAEVETPLESDLPIVQRRSAEIQRQSVESGATPPPLSDEEFSAQTEEPSVQRQIADIQRQPVESFTTPPALGELPDQTEKPIRPQPATRDQSSAVAQPPAAKPHSPQVTLQRRSVTTEPPPGDHVTAPSADLTSPRSAQLPLVQRQPAIPEPAQSAEAFTEAPADLQVTSSSQVTPLQAEAQTEPKSAHIDRPLVQRQKSDMASASLPPMVQRHAAEAPEPADEIDQAEEIVQRSVDLSAPAPAPIMPLTAPARPVVQRQPAETKATPPAAPIPVAPHIPQTVQPGEKKIVAPLTDALSPAAHIEMPLVQRQAAETEFETADLESEEIAAEDAATPETVQRQATPAATPAATSPRKVVVPAIKPAAPHVQRHTAEPIAPIEPVEPLGNVTSAIPPASAEAHAPLEMPFVQRQPLEVKSAATPSHSTVVQRSADSDEVEAAPAQPASDLSERILSRVTPPERRAAVKPVELPLHYTPIQHESQPEAVSFSQPTASERSATPFASSPVLSGAAPVIQRLAEPVIQRTPSEPETSSSDAGFIQRVETVPAATTPEAEAAKPADLDHLARQIYPLIKRLIAIERERRAFR